jgi:hypothetical protein
MSITQMLVRERKGREEKKQETYLVKSVVPVLRECRRELKKDVK